MSTEENLPEGWVWTTLGTIGEYINGYAFNDELWSKTGRPIIRIQDLTGTRKTPNYFDGEIDNKYLVHRGDFLIAWSATLGAFIWNGPEAWLNQHIFKVTSYIDKLFHYYLVQSTIDELYNKAHGSGMIHVTRGVFSNIRVSLPPLPEQHRIVAAIEQLFTRLDSAVASLKSAKEHTKQYRASLLKTAVEGELTKAWRTENPTEETGEQLLKRILNERRARWEEEQLAKMREKGILILDDSWKKKYKEPQEPDVENLPELPEGWCWATVEQMAEVSTGATPLRNRNEYYMGGTIPWITSGSVNQKLISSAEEFITEKALKETNTKVFPIGTLILAMYGEGKTRGMVSELGISAATNQACAAIIFGSSSTQCRPYIKAFLSSNYLTLRASAVGGVQPNLNLTLVKETLIPLPPLAEQEAITSELEAHLSELEHMEVTIEHSLQRAEHERQSILCEAFAGRLVPQNPEDEPASILLERIQEERKKLEEEGKATRTSRKGKQMKKKSKANISSTGKAGISLYEKLIEVDRPLPPEDLFKQVGLKIDDQPESVETFYLELQINEDAGLIREVPNKPPVLLEALEAAKDHEWAEDDENELVSQYSPVLEKQTVEPEQPKERIHTQTLWDFE